MRHWPSDRFTIRDLLVLVLHSPPECALTRAMVPDQQPHRMAQHQLELLRLAEHSLRWLVWAKTEDGPRGRNQPEPYRFPWEPERDGGWRGDAMTLAEADEFLGWADKQLDAGGESDSD